MTCPFCAAIDAARDDATVARLLDGLCDELTVRRLDAETTGRARRSLEKGAVKIHRRGDVYQQRSELRAKARLHLAGGPLRAIELTELLHGYHLDAETRLLRFNATRALLRRLIKNGEIAKVGHGWYALPEATDGMKHRTIRDCKRVLADLPTVARRAFTVAELAERLDVQPVTVNKWLQRLRGAGHDLRRRELRRPDGQRTYAYWIETAPATNRAGRRVA